MKKLFLAVGAIMGSVLVAQGVFANTSFNQWNDAYVNSLTSPSMQSMACDETVYSEIYQNKYGILVDYFNNTSAQPTYLWRYKIFTYGNYVLYNPSSYPGKDTGMMIFNRNKLTSFNTPDWKVMPGQTVRHLTTAEEVGAPATFSYAWNFASPYVSVTPNQYGAFSFSKPNYRNPGTHPTIPSFTPAYDAEVRTATFYDGDNSKGSTPDNKGVLECYRIQVRRCGDGILAPAQGELCDNGLGNGQPGNACSLTCTPNPIPLYPDVTVIKSVTGSNIQGQNVTYKLTYNNIGQGAAQNVVITDTLGTGLTFLPATSLPPAASVVNNANGTTTIVWNLGVLPAGSGGTITFQAQIKANVPNCTTVKNKVHIASSNELYPNTLNNDYEVTSPIQCPQNPHLWIQKDVVASTGGYIPNGYALYTLTYGNNGSGTATGVVMTDTLPAGVSFHSSIPAAATVVGQTITWNIGTLLPGQQGVIKIYVKINANVPVCQNYTIHNRAIITATNAGPQTDDATFLVLCYDLYSNKIIDKPLVVSGDIVTYTIRYGNSGQISAPLWTLIDNLPAGLQYVPGSTMILSGLAIGQPVVTGTPVAGQVLKWSGSNMLAGYSGMISVKAQILGPVVSGHVYLNQVCIEGDNNYNNNNCGTAVTTATGSTGGGGMPLFDLNIHKTVSKTVVTYGDILTYTLLITNESDVTAPATGYSVKDYLPGGVEYLGNPTGPAGMNTTLSAANKEITFTNLPALAPGASITITFQGTYKSSVAETNYTEICTYNGKSQGTGVIKDRDSDPCNMPGKNTPHEDDEDQVTVTPQTSPPGNPECQGLSSNPSVTNYTTNSSQVSVEYECKTTWNGYVDAVMDCGNGTIFTGLTSNANPFKPTCIYNNPTTTTAVCTVARKPNVNCQLPVVIKSGNTGCPTCGSNPRPYCGNGIVNLPEQCDPGNPLLGISPAGVPPGQVCRSDCTYGNQPGGMSAQVKCSYIDPPSINVGEYMPYRWDMEYDFHLSGGNGYGTATTSCNATGDVRVNKNTLRCEFTLQGPTGIKKIWEQGCYDNPHFPLIDTAFTSAEILYGLPYPGGRGAVQITGSYYLGLGEYIIEMKVVSGKLCNGTVIAMGNRVCQMNFGVTKQYAVTRTTRGTASSTTDLPTYKRTNNAPVLQTNENIKTLEPFILTQTDKSLLNQMINKYVKLSVKADTIEDKIDNKTIQVAVVSKVPSKNIFIIDAKTAGGLKGTITISDKASYQGGAFTLIVINGDLVIKGDLTKNANGMFLVRDGDLIFSAEGDAVHNNQNQDVKGIFIGLKAIKAEGDGQPAFNNDVNKPWINGGRLTLNGILLGGDLSILINGRRSVVENRFTQQLPEGLFDDGAIVIKANPAIFTNLPPGAEDIALTLNVFKK